MEVTPNLIETKKVLEMEKDLDQESQEPSESFIEKIKNLSSEDLLEALDSKLFKRLVAVVSLIVFLIFIIPSFLDNSELKFQLTQKISKLTKANFSIKGAVRVAILPHPALVAEDILLENYSTEGDSVAKKKYNLYAKSLRFELPFFRFSSNSALSKIVVKDAILEVIYDTGSKNIRDNKFQDIADALTKDAADKEDGFNVSFGKKIFPISTIDETKLSDFTNLPNIVIKNGEIIFYNSVEQKREITAVEANLTFDSKKISGYGNFISEGIGSKFKLLAKFNSQSSKKDSFFEIKSPALQLRINGNFISENHGVFASEFIGSLEAEITELKSFYKSYLDPNGVISQKLKYNAKPIKISGKIESKSRLTSLKDLSINSNLLNGNGEAILDFSQKIPLLDIALNLENIDLDSIWSDEAITIQEVLSKQQPSKSSSAEIFDQIAAQPQKKDSTQILPTPTIDVKKSDNSVRNEKEEITKSVKLDSNSLNTTNLSANIRLDRSSSSGTTNIITQKKEVSALELTPAAISAIISNEAQKPNSLSYNDESLAPSPDYKNLIQSKEMDLTAEININKIQYMEGEIRDANLYLTMSNDGKILLLPLIFKVPGDAIFRINGVIDNTTPIAKFIGKFDASGKNFGEIFKWLKIESQNLKFENLREYGIYSDILALPNSIAFSNFYLNLNNGTSEFLGDVKITSGEKSTNISSSFRVGSFNVNDYFFTSEQNAYLSTGSMLKKVLWLNDISSSVDLNLKFEKLIFGKEEFSDQLFALKFGRGYLEIPNSHLQSPQTDLQLNFVVDISDKKPRLELDLKANNFHYNSSRISNEEDNSKNKSISKKLKNRNFFDQFYSLPSLEGFDGKVAIDIKNLNLDETQIGNAKLTGNLKDGTIDQIQASCDIYEGSLTYKGLIDIRYNKIINGNWSLKNVSLQPLLWETMNIKNISGIANIEGSVTSIANTKYSFAKDLRSEIKFGVVLPAIHGYGLSDLVKKMFLPQANREELQNPENILINQSAKTFFKEASGEMQINNGQDGKIKIKLSAPAINGIFSGRFVANEGFVDGTLGIVFLTGSRQKQIPINIATAIKFGEDGFMQATNVDQARQYLGLTKRDNSSKLILDNAEKAAKP